MLRKANQKRSLDDLVIQKGDFDWQNFFRAEEGGSSSAALQRALMEFEDVEDANAAKVAANEEAAAEGEERAEFADADLQPEQVPLSAAASGPNTPGPAAEGEDEGETVTDYMLRVVQEELDYFRNREWRLS